MVEEKSLKVYVKKLYSMIDIILDGDYMKWADLLHGCMSMIYVHVHAQLVIYIFVLTIVHKLDSLSRLASLSISHLASLTIRD